MTDFRAVYGQIEQGPLVGARIVFKDPIRGPQVAPNVVLAVHDGVVGLHRWIGHRNDLHLTRPGIDTCKRRAPRIANPKDIGVLVGAHATRSL